jgi:hypothetical protein
MPLSKLQIEGENYTHVSQQWPFIYDDELGYGAIVCGVHFGTTLVDRVGQCASVHEPHYLVEY